ncbi:MAG: hypothetical protein LAT64_11845 [Phycisphaerales bacterium]|nr:hypothetical protein [Planctomycetota bacterium]MCH8509444.1 hypothetical protein [Phycisphaerales bacterium]
MVAPAVPPDRRAVERAYKPRESGWGRFWAVFGDIVLGMAWWWYDWRKQGGVATERMTPLAAALLGLVVMAGFALALSGLGLEPKIVALGSVLLIGTLCLAGAGLTTRAERRAARSRACACRACGYALHGLPSVGAVESDGARYEIGPARCPECGQVWPRVLPG